MVPFRALHPFIIKHEMKLTWWLPWKAAVLALLSLRMSLLAVHVADSALATGLAVVDGIAGYNTYARMG